MFDIPLPIYFFTKEHPLKTSNKRTHIPLLINQFASLIELTQPAHNALRTSPNGPTLFETSQTIIGLK